LRKNENVNGQWKEGIDRKRERWRKRKIERVRERNVMYIASMDRCQSKRDKRKDTSKKERRKIANCSPRIVRVKELLPLKEPESDSIVLYTLHY
tara:strand:+ start:284 stop:565 length:282 start_codon:yes stop_codon:yes gene_type:complete